MFERKIMEEIIRRKTRNSFILCWRKRDGLKTIRLPFNGCMTPELLTFAIT